MPPPVPVVSLAKENIYRKLPKEFVQNKYKQHHQAHASLACGFAISCAGMAMNSCIGGKNLQPNCISLILKFFWQTSHILRFSANGNTTIFLEFKHPSPVSHSVLSLSLSLARFLPLAKARRPSQCQPEQPAAYPPDASPSKDFVVGVLVEWVALEIGSHSTIASLAHNRTDVRTWIFSATSHALFHSPSPSISRPSKVRSSRTVKRFNYLTCFWVKSWEIFKFFCPNSDCRGLLEIL